MSDFAPNGVLGQPFDPSTDFGAAAWRDQIGAAQEDNLGPAERRERLPESSGGEKTVESERLGGVEKENIEIAGEPPMLKTVVQKDDISFGVFLKERFSGGETVRRKIVRDAGKKLGQFKRLVVLRPEWRVGVIRRRLPRCPISAA